MKHTIELIPITDNLFQCAGSIIRCVFELNLETPIIRKIENRMLGTFKKYPLRQSIQILNVFQNILQDEGINLVNGITHKKGFIILNITTSIT